MRRFEVYFYFKQVLLTSVLIQLNFRETENYVPPPELASWPPRMKKDEALYILAVSVCQIIPVTCRSWSFFVPMLWFILLSWTIFSILKSLANLKIAVWGWGQEEPFETKNKVGLSWPSTTLKPLEGPGGQTQSGTLRDWNWSQKEPFNPKIKFWPWQPGGFRWLNMGIDAEVKRNRLKQKTNLASAGLRQPWGHWRVLRGPDTGRDHQGLMLRSRGPVWPKK